MHLVKSQYFTLLILVLFQFFGFMKLCLLIFNLRLDFLCWKPFHLREVVAQENLTNMSK